MKFDFLWRSQWKSEIEVIEENCIFEVAIEMNFAMEVSNGVRMRVQLLQVAHETQWVAVNMRCNLQWQKYEIEWTVKVEKFEMKVPRFIEKNVDLARLFEHSSICAIFLLLLYESSSHVKNKQTKTTINI